MAAADGGEGLGLGFGQRRGEEAKRRGSSWEVGRAWQSLPWLYSPRCKAYGRKGKKKWAGPRGSGLEVGLGQKKISLFSLWFLFFFCLFFPVL